MMLLLLHDDRPQSVYSRVVEALQCPNLLVHVPEDDTLDCDCGRSNRLSPGEAGDRSKNEAAEPAPEVASASTLTTADQLRTEDGAMATLVGEEPIELLQHVGCSPPGKPPLGEVDGDGAVLASVIDFHHPVAESLSSI